MSPADLQRLATHVHSSMSRAITPFATEFDGDVLYAVSTGELDANTQPDLSTLDLDVLGAELMWDAILSAVPEQPPAATAPATRAKVSASALQSYAGTYVFSPVVSVTVKTDHDKLFAQATGKRPAYAIGKDSPVELQPVSSTDFVVPGRYPLTLRFNGARLVINPGHWEQIGQR
jgi:hypothetical protein